MCSSVKTHVSNQILQKFAYEICFWLNFCENNAQKCIKKIFNGKNACKISNWQFRQF